MERDEFTCQGCGDKDSTLNVHHLRYIKGRNVWDYDDLILITLCESCHELNHSEYDSEFDNLKQLAQSNGFGYIDLNYIANFIMDFSSKLGKERKKDFIFKYDDNE